jgi:hypothetical protein
MELLTGLRGVGVPMASAILTLLDPRRYGVLDIRAWQLLFAIRSVGANRRGQGFTIVQWEQYLDALRYHARRLRTTARAIEYTLFLCHRKFQHGLLYTARPSELTLEPSVRAWDACMGGHLGAPHSKRARRPPSVESVRGHHAGSDCARRHRAADRG